MGRLSGFSYRLITKRLKKNVVLPLTVKPLAVMRFGIIKRKINIRLFQIIPVICLKEH